jgi:hypothetical protein
MPLNQCVQLLLFQKTLFARHVPEGWTQINHLKTGRVEDRRSKRAIMGNRSFWKLKSREKYLFSETFLETKRTKQMRRCQRLKRSYGHDGVPE